MPTISYPQEAKIIIQPGESFRVTASGTAQVRTIFGAPEGTVTITAGTQTFGPYMTEAKFELKATAGQVEYYEVIESPATLPPGAVGNASFDSGGRLLDASGAVVLDVGAAQDRIDGEAWLTDPEFGGPVDGDWTQAFSLGIAKVLAAVGGGVLRIPPGSYTASTVTLPSGVVLVGAGSAATEIVQKAGTSGPLITSQGFASLTGQNKWLVSDGMPHGFGIKGVRLNGNKAAQTATNDGVKIYGKRVFFDDVLIFDCKGRGWYSEGGYIGGQQSWRDLPESRIAVRVRNCDGDGFVFRGPHDAHIKELYVNECDGRGAAFETVVDQYNASCDIGFIHNYANGGIGFYSDSQIRFQHVISESGLDEGFVISGWGTQGGMVQLYNNCRSSGTYHARLSGKRQVISNIQVDNKETLTASGILLDCGESEIRGAVCIGNGGTGTGVRATGSFTQSSVSGVVSGYSGANGVGVVTNSGGGALLAEFNLAIKDCMTSWNNAANGSIGKYQIRVSRSAGQVGFTGSQPTGGGQTAEIWDVRDYDGATVKTTRFRKLSGFDINLNSTTEQEFTMGCSELIFAPQAHNVCFALHYAGTNSAFRVDYVKLHAISASFLTFRAKIGIPAGAAETAKLLVWVDLG